MQTNIFTAKISRSMVVFIAHCVLVCEVIFKLLTLYTFYLPLDMGGWLLTCYTADCT